MSSWPIIETDDSDSEEDYLSHQCRRFRILIMGKAGVGKSTLLSRVFGIPEDDVSSTAPKCVLLN
jgi:predicted GTPase